MHHVNSRLLGKIGSLSEKKKEVLALYMDSDPLIEHFVLYGIKGKCIRECKSTSLSKKLQNPDPVLIEQFDRYVPYSYLHFAYYKVNLDHEMLILHFKDHYCFSWRSLRRLLGVASPSYIIIQRMSWLCQVYHFTEMR